MENMENLEALNGAIVFGFLILATSWEWLSGKFENGRKTAMDWKMAGISLGMLNFIQRPLLMFVVYALMAWAFPAYHEALRPLEQQWLIPCIIGFLMLEELLHGLGHYFAHSRRPKARWLQYVHAFYRIAHRPHHFSGGNEGKGELNATQAYVEGWAWMLILPNLWLHFITLYLGLYETFFIGMTIKGLWSVHNHVNWNYDLYFHNHRWAWVRKLMWGLAHIFTFPTQHQHHHARGANSAKNMTNFLALYDWLIFKTLVIEKERPKVFGWRQSEEEEGSALYRFFNTDLKQYVR